MTSLLNITAGAEKVLQSDPHGWTLTVVAIGVVFSCLLILFGVYSLSGAIFKRLESEDAGRQSPRVKCRKDEALAAAIGTALYLNGSDETEAAIAAALHLYLGECAHDIESGVITIKDCASPWASKGMNFRKTPSRK